MAKKKDQAEPQRSEAEPQTEGQSEVTISESGWPPNLSHYDLADELEKRVKARIVAMYFDDHNAPGAAVVERIASERYAELKQFWNDQTKAPAD